MKKRFLGLLVSLSLLIAFGVNAGAACVAQEVIDLGDGFTMTVVTEDAKIQPYASSKSKTKTATVVYSGTTVGKFSLTGYFAYNGSTATATDADWDATSYGSWDYKNGSASYSGAKVSGKCTFYNGSVSKTASLSMTCSKDGTIS